MKVSVHKWLDLIDRAGWTAVQAAGAALLTYLTDSSGMGWEEAVKFVGFAALLAVTKVVVGQNTGGDDTGALIGAPVVEPAPESP